MRTRGVGVPVFMGMGEPLLNLRQVLNAHTFLNKQLGIGARHLTISTVGVPNAIAKLAAHKLQSTLAVSLHAPNQALRETLVPRSGLRLPFSRPIPLLAWLRGPNQALSATEVSGLVRLAKLLHRPSVLLESWVGGG